MGLSLWEDDSEISANKGPSAKKVKEKVKKAAPPKTDGQILRSKVATVSDRIGAVTREVHRILGKYRDDTICIYERDKFHDYVSKCIENGVIAIDTETNNSTETFLPYFRIMGLCLYTPGMKNLYVPINHVDRFKCSDPEDVDVIEKEAPRLPNQLTEKDIGEEMQRIKDAKTFTIFHNAPFDVETINQTCGVRLHINWDTQTGAWLLNEEEKKSLKTQNVLHLDKNAVKYDIEHLFNGLPYSIFPPELFALYAATDPKLTYDLYMYQKSQFSSEENKGIIDLRNKVEFPILDTVIDMESRGIKVDIEYAKKMSEEFHRRDDKAVKEVNEEMEKLKPLIAEWRKTDDANTPQVGKTGKVGKTKNQQLKDPVELTSPAQLSILLYDVMKVPVVDEKHPRGTGAAILKELSEAKKIKLCELILKKRGIETLLNNFIDKIIKLYNSSSNGRVHARFNSTGTKTGRFSSGDKDDDDTPALKSKDPSLNMQNIPAGEKTIRGIFEGSTEYGESLCEIDTYKVSYMDDVLTKDGWKTVNSIKYGDDFGKCGKVYSVQFDGYWYYFCMFEGDRKSVIKTRRRYAICGSDFSAQEIRVAAAMSNDKAMIGAYKEGKDLYSVTGSISFQCAYEDCLEFDPRNGGKQSQEGKARRKKAKTVLLGLQYGMSTQSLADRIDCTVKEAQEIVDKLYSGFTGLKKFTNDLQKKLKKDGYVVGKMGRKRHLPDATLPEYTVREEKKKDRFNPLLGTSEHIDEELEKKIANISSELVKAKTWKEKNIIIAKAKKEGLEVINNNKAISRTMRQCLNAVVQGSAGTMTKIAMIKITNDPELNRLGARLLCTVHDEVFCEAPIVNAKRCGDRIGELMIEAAKELCPEVPWKCDPYVVADGWYEDEVMSAIVEKKEKHNLGLNEICEAYPMYSRESVEKVLEGTYAIGVDSLKYGPNYYICKNV